MKKCSNLVVKCVCLLITSLLIGCSPNNNRNDEKIISDKIEEISQNNVELTKFTKVSEQEVNWYGNMITIVEFDGIIMYKKAGNIIKLSFEPFADENINFLNLKLNIKENEKTYYPESVKKNAVKNIQGKIVYEKNTNGLETKPNIYINLK